MFEIKAVCHIFEDPEVHRQSAKSRITCLDEVVGHDGAKEDDEAVARDGDQPLGLVQEPCPPGRQVAPLTPSEVFEFLELNQRILMKIILFSIEWMMCQQK